MTVSQRIKFFRQIATLIRAGVPIRASLVRLKEKRFASEVGRLSDRVNNGERLGDAFEGAGFSPFECHLVAAGEISGQLDAIFDHLSEFWAREQQMRQAMLRTLIYPIVLIHLTFIVGAIVDFSLIGEGVAIAHFITRMAFFYAAGFVIYTLVQVSWPSQTARTFWLMVPFIGGTLKAAYAYRWITAMRLEFGAGISLYRAVGDAWLASDFTDCKQRAKEGEAAMLGGAQLSALIKKWRQLPREWVDYVETGELSGDLNGTFDALQKEAAERWRLALERMSDWVPKIAYFILLLIVGYIVYKLYIQAVIDPMTKIQDAIDSVNK